MLHLATSAIVAAILLGNGGLSGQGSGSSDQTPAAPAAETRDVGDHREKALWVKEARPTGAYGRDGTPPTWSWIDAGSETIRNAGIAIVALLLLAWWRRRRTIRYC